MKTFLSLEAIIFQGSRPQDYCGLDTTFSRERYSESDDAVTSGSRSQQLTHTQDIISTHNLFFFHGFVSARLRESVD